MRDGGERGIVGGSQVVRGGGRGSRYLVRTPFYFQQIKNGLFNIHRVRGASRLIHFSSDGL